MINELELLSYVQLLGGILLSIGGVFLIIKLISIKESRDFSLVWTWLALIGILLMEIYAIGIYLYLKTWGFLVSNSISLILQTITLILIIKYWRSNA